MSQPLEQDDRIVPLQDLIVYKQLFQQLAAAKVPPEESNYLIQHNITLRGVVGEIVEHYGSSFAKSSTQLVDHLQLQGIKPQDKLKLTPEQWTAYVHYRDGGQP